MTKRIDLVGQVFGRLTVTSYCEFKNTKNYWNCVCACGRLKAVITGHLKSGKVLSCGCLRKELFVERVTTHGLAGKAKNGKYRCGLYVVWKGMLSRCNNHNNKKYFNYGGRGISVCDDWKDFLAFNNWAMSNGYSKGLQIDRIDNSKGYSPDNCRFVTQKVNCRNKRNNRKFTVRGENLCVTELSEKYGQPIGRITNRLGQGWDIEKALFTAVKIYAPRKTKPKI
jgi:hypothetical protein